MGLTLGKRRRLAEIWHDSGFKKTFTLHCSDIGITSQSVQRTSSGTFEVPPYRWIAEHSWAWLINHRRLRIDHERAPAVTTGFVLAAHTRTLLRRLTPTPTKPTSLLPGCHPADCGIIDASHQHPQNPPLFCPDATVTRAQMASLLHRTRSYTPSEDAPIQPLKKR